MLANKNRMKNVVLFSTLVYLFSFSCMNSLQSEFVPPSERSMSALGISKIEEACSLRGINTDSKNLGYELTEKEKAGFLGYHGNNIEFLIYQDIIRMVIEEIIQLPVRDDFHFLSVPLDPTHNIQTKEQLAEVFLSEKNPSLALADTTFPLNFSIWDNMNRQGLNSLENYEHNKSYKPLGYKRRLHWFFDRLGIKKGKIENLYKELSVEMNANIGVIVMFFDESQESYQLSKKIAYPAYPNGFIAANRTVDEYFLDAFNSSFPHEIRLILNNHQTLNPASPLKMNRILPDWFTLEYKRSREKLRKSIKKLSYSKEKVESYKKELINAWETS